MGLSGKKLIGRYSKLRHCWCKTFSRCKVSFFLSVDSTLSVACHSWSHSTSATTNWVVTLVAVLMNVDSIEEWRRQLVGITAITRGWCIHLTGSIPREFGHLINLRDLYLSRNKFSCKHSTCFCQGKIMLVADLYLFTIVSLSLRDYPMRAWQLVILGNAQL